MNKLTNWIEQLKAVFTAGDWDGLGAMLGDSINKAFEQLSSLDVGAKLGTFVSNVTTTLHSLLATTDFGQIGQSVAKMLGDSFGQIDWKQAGQTIGQAFTALPSVIVGFVTETDWSQVGQNVLQCLQGAFGTVTAWVQETDWLQIGQSVSGLLDAVDWEGVKTAFDNLLPDSFGSIDFSAVSASLEGLGAAVQDFGETVSQKLQSAWENVLVPLGKWVIEEAAPASVDALSAVINALSGTVAMLDFGPLTESVGAVTGKFGELISKLTEEFSWVYTDILEPLAEWVIEDAAPATVGTLSTAFDALRAAVEPVSNALQVLWKSALEPAVLWVEEKALSVLDFFKEKFQTLSAVIEENGPKISTIVSGLGTVVSALWAVCEPILNGIYERAEKIAGTTFTYFTNEVQIAIDKLSGLTEFLSGTFTGDWDRAWSGLVTISRARGDEIENGWKLITNSMSFASYGLVGLIASHWDEIKAVLFPAGSWMDMNVIHPIEGFFEEMWLNVSNWASDAWVDIQGFFQPAADWFGELFGSVEQTFDDIFGNIAVIAGGCWDVICIAWQGAGTWFEGIWSDIKEVFRPAATWFESTFAAAWQKVVNVFSVGGEIFKDIKDGVLQGLKNAVNWLIDGLNKVIAKPFNGINEALGKIRDIKIVGIQPFKDLKDISIPEIPKLARGGVVDGPTQLIAGEKGKEAIVPLENNTEWIDKVADKVSTRVSGGGGGNQPMIVQVFLGKRKLTEYVIQDINQITKSTGVCPIKV